MEKGSSPEAQRPRMQVIEENIGWGIIQLVEKAEAAAEIAKKVIITRRHFLGTLALAGAGLAAYELLKEKDWMEIKQNGYPENANPDGDYRLYDNTSRVKVNPLKFKEFIKNAGFDSPPPFDISFAFIDDKTKQVFPFNNKFITYNLSVAEDRLGRNPEIYGVTYSADMAARIEFFLKYREDFSHNVYAELPTQYQEDLKRLQDKWVGEFSPKKDGKPANFISFIAVKAK